MAFGLGFIFNSRSKNVRRDLQDTERGLDRINGSLRGLAAEAGRNAFGRFIDGLQVHKLNQISEALDRMANSQGNGRLSNGLDSMAATVSKDVRKAFVGLNVSQAQLNKLSGQAVGIARGLNVSAEQVIGAGVAFERFGGTTKAGFKSLKDAVRTFEVFGVSAEDYMETTKTISGVTGQSEASIRDLAGQVLQIGKQFGFGTEALQAFSKEGGNVSLALQAIGETSPEAMKKASHSIAMLGGAIAKSGTMKGPAAFDAAGKVFSEVQKSANSWQKALAAGATPDGMLGELSRFLGPDAINVAQKSATDPAYLIGRLADEYERLGQSADPVAKSQRKMIETFAADNFSIDLAVSGKAVSKYLKEFDPKAMDKAGDKMDALAKATHRSGRTIDEVLSMMEEGFESRLRGIMRRDGTMSRYVKRQQQAYKAVGDAAVELSSDDGPLGMLSNALLRVNTFGFKGLFMGSGDAVSGLGAVASVAFDAAASLAPAATALGAMGLHFRHLLAPVKALTAPIGAVNALLGGLPMAALSMAKIPAMIGLGIAGIGALGSSEKGKSGFGIVDYVKNKLPADILWATTGFSKKGFQKKFGMSMAQMIASGGAWQVVGAALKNGLSKAWTWLADNFMTGAGMIASAGKMALSFATKWMDYIIAVDWSAKFKSWWTTAADAIGNVDSGGITAVAMKIATVLEKAATAAWKFLSGAAGALIDGITHWWDSMPGGTMDKIKSIWESHGTTIGKALIAGMFLSSGVRGFAMNAVGTLLSGAKGMMSSAVSGLANSGVGPGANKRRNAAGQIMAKSRLQAAGGGAAMGAMAGLANLAAGGSWVESAGMTLGGAIGGAIAGPLGATLGTLAGHVAGSFLEDYFGDSPAEKYAKKLADEFKAEDKDRLMKPLVQLFNDVSEYGAGLVSREMERHGAALTAMANTADAAEIQRMDNETRLEMLRLQMAGTKDLARNWRKLGSSSEVLSDIQRGALLPVMRDLRDSGKLTAEHWNEFVTNGKLGLRGKELADFGIEVRRDTAFMANADRRIAQELELKLATIKAKEEAAAAGGKIKVAQAEMGARGAQGARVDFQGKLAKYEDVINKVMASDKYKEVEGRRSGRVNLIANTRDSIMQNMALGWSGRGAIEKIAKNSKFGKAMMVAMDKAGASGKSKGSAVSDAAQAAIDQENKYATKAVTESLQEAALAAGVELPDEITSLIKDGIMPLEGDLNGLRKKWKDHLGTLITDEETANKKVEAANLEMLTISVKARQDEADAILEAGKRREAAQLFGQLVDEINATKMSNAAKKKAIDDATGQLLNAGASSGLDLLQRQTDLRVKYSLKAAESQASSADGPMSTTQSSVNGPDVEHNAYGGTVTAPAIISDQSSGRVIGTMAESGPEYIVPAGPGGATLADVVRALRNEGERTRRVIERSRPKVTVTGAGSGVTAHLR
jgi:hypothetical protein